MSIPNRFSRSCAVLACVALGGGVRVPMFATLHVRAAAGRTFDPPVSWMDIFATELTAAGRSPNRLDLDGTSLLPVMLGQTEAAPHDELFWRYHGHRAIRRGDWKLIVFADGRMQLFNLRTDLGETTDLAPTEPQRVEQLRA